MPQNNSSSSSKKSHKERKIIIIVVAKASKLGLRLKISSSMWDETRSKIMKS